MQVITGIGLTCLQYSNIPGSEYIHYKSKFKGAYDDKKSIRLETKLEKALKSIKEDTIYWYVFVYWCTRYCVNLVGSFHSSIGTHISYQVENSKEKKHLLKYLRTQRNLEILDHW